MNLSSFEFSDIMGTCFDSYVSSALEVLLLNVVLMVIASFAG